MINSQVTKIRQLNNHKSLDYQILVSSDVPTSAKGNKNHILSVFKYLLAAVNE